MKNSYNKDAYGHVRGESLFVDDIPVIEGTLYGAVFYASIAHGKIESIYIEKALNAPGVQTILTAKDIKGTNQIGGIVKDEPLFAEDEVHFLGQPIALVLAKTFVQAKQARKLIQCEISPLPIITTAKEAFDLGQFVCPSRTFELADIETGFKESKYIFEGEVFSNGQEHLYLETQGAYAIPQEGENVKIISSTQGPTLLQKTVATVLGKSMHKIEVEVYRLGGGFGGKEDQATAWGVLAALGADHLNKPVKVVLDRHDDLIMTGKRHPYSSKFKIGLDENFTIKAYQAEFLQNSGAAADLSPAIAERTLFHATNSYFVPYVKVTVHCCKTNLAPNTAFRGFGGPQGMFVIESAISKAANELSISPKVIQEANLLKEGDQFPYGQIGEHVEIRKAWRQLDAHDVLIKTEKEIANFNLQNEQFKKGMSLMPVTFGISFTNTPMNHARALVHVYQDGSVGVSTGAVEMGQGVNTKMQQIAADVFGIPVDLVKIETTNTTRVANTSPSAASSTADLNGKALLQACKAIRSRLFEVIRATLNIEDWASIRLENKRVMLDKESSTLTWEGLIQEAFLKRVNLSEKGHYATPIIHFDKQTEKGHPFAYHVYGVALTVVQIDCLRGIYDIEKVVLVHDFGKSMNIGIDYGQIEGGLVQGLGWMTMEEIKHDENGRLLADTLSTYKIPDIFSAPKSIEIHPLESEGHDMAILKSKAVGEPPLMYGIGAYFALQNAIKSFNENYQPIYDAPMTPEKVLNSLYNVVELES